MKKLPLKLLAITAVSSSLFAQNTSYNLNIPSIPSSGDPFNFAPKLMMNSLTAKEGTQAIGEILEIFGRRVLSAKSTVTKRGGVEISSVRAGRSDIVAAVFSSNVLRLRGGPKHTGDISDEEDNSANLQKSFSSAPITKSLGDYIFELPQCNL